MIPEELYKRRRNHNKTPKSMLLILANYVVVLLGASLFTSCDHINWFFWVIEGGLAIYNFFTIRRNREEFENKSIVYSYVFSLVILVGVFFLFQYI